MALIAGKVKSLPQRPGYFPCPNSAHDSETPNHLKPAAADVEVDGAACAIPASNATEIARDLIMSQPMCGKASLRMKYRGFTNGTTLGVSGSCICAKTERAMAAKDNPVPNEFQKVSCKIYFPASTW